MSVSVCVRGPFACFTRPEMKVERMSYPVPTPSAARGILEAILFKPEFQWRVRRIHVLKPIQFIGLKRNEVKGKVQGSKARKWALGDGEVEPLWADENGGTEGRTQRNTIALKDVAYVFDAEIAVRRGAKEPDAKYEEMFDRRMRRGQCFAQPAFGCREFAAYFEPPRERFEAIRESRDLGLMLYDVFDLDAENKPGECRPYITLWRPEMKGGVIEIEDWASVKRRYVAGGRDA